jgi:RNA polymerase sigma-70 factor, ECF subfamily
MAMIAAEPSHQAPASDRSNQAFERLAEPFRREIKLHCYRMLGSLHTYLRAWRSFDRFEEGSFRAWLYRIATNACLNAIASRKHAQRFIPTGGGAAAQSGAARAPRPLPQGLGRT